MAKRGLAMKTAFLAATVAAFFWYVPLDMARAADPTDVELLKIPFAPPVGQDLKYDVTTTKVQPNRNTVSRTKQALRFDHIGGAYYLTVTILRMEKDGTAVDLTTPAGMLSLPAEIRPFLQPVTLELDSDGAFIRVRDWTRFQQALTALPDLISKADNPSDAAQAKAIGNRVIAPYMRMTAEQAPAAILKGWPAVFGFGGLELEAGAEYEGEEQMPSPLLPVSMTVRQRFSLARNESDGTLGFHKLSTPDPEKLRAAAVGFVSSLGDGADAAYRANVEKAAAMMETMKVDDRLDAFFDPSTGLVQRATIERRVSFGDAGQGGETITISRSKD